MMILTGWIDDVENGVVYGRLLNDVGDEIYFEVDIFDIEEGQRVDLEPGRYVSIVNGHLLLYKTMWTTHEIEQADAEAERLWKELGWDKHETDQKDA